jgi:serine/threonine-protein kinase
LKILDSEILGPAAWAANDTLIFSDGSALFRMAAGGGENPERLTPAGDSGTALFAPVLLPGERAVLFTSSAGESVDVAVLDLATREQRVVAEDAMLASYASSGHVVFVERGGALMAAPFDLSRLVLTGEPVRVLQGIRLDGAPDYALSRNGTLVYVPDEAQARTLVWVDRTGRAVERAVNEIVEAPWDPRLSPDGRRLVLATGNDLWIYDLGGRPPILLAETTNGLGVWSPDGTQIAFVSNRSGTFNVYALAADGSARDPQAVNPRGLDAAPSAWSTSGDLILARPFTNPVDIVAARVEAQGELRDVLATADAEAYPALSPDGRWLAYTSNRTGRLEVWVTAYPNGVPERISRNGGTEPVWSRDGRELFYRQGAAMMAVTMDTAGEELSFGASGELFNEPYLSSPAPTARTYDVAPDGRFLMIQLDGSSDGSASIVVVQNWTEELKRQVPVSH